MKKIMIIGCCGSGKTTLAKKLSNKLNLPLIHLDKLNWRDNWKNISKEEFDDLLWAEVVKSTWIIDGNYGRTLEMRIQWCEAIFLLDFPVEECLVGAKSRIGKQRVDMPWIETEFDEEFKQWIMDFPKNELPIVYELLDRYKGEKSIYVFHSRADIEDYLSKTFG